jgi:hypothetical protein
MGRWREAPEGPAPEGLAPDGLAIQSVAALHAKAVPAQVVMPARWTHQSSRRVRLEPPLVLAPVPDPVLGSEHPPPSLVVEHAQVAHRDPERARLQAPRAPFLDQEPVSDLRFRERIYRHAAEYADSPLLESNRL